MRFDERKHERTVINLKGFFASNELDRLFETLKKRYPANAMLSLNEGLVRPALWRDDIELRKQLRADDIADCLSKTLGFKLMATDHSDYHVNTLGGWHDDTGAHVGGYIPSDMVYPSCIFKVAVFNRGALESGSQTQFRIDGSRYIPEVTYGDVICFPIEVKHRGYPGNFATRIVRKLRVWSDGSCSLRKLESLIRRCERREAFFFTVGLPGRNLDHFVNSSKEREDQQLAALNA